jgi:hypothetical protein
MSSDADGMSYLVAVLDLRRDRYRHLEAAYSDPPTRHRDDGEKAAVITDLTLKRNGSVAWISCFPAESSDHECISPGPDLPYEVWRADTHGRQLLDASEKVKLRSLHRTRSTLTWRHDDEPHTAKLR